MHGSSSKKEGVCLFLFFLHYTHVLSLNNTSHGVTHICTHAHMHTCTDTHPHLPVDTTDLALLFVQHYLAGAQHLWHKPRPSECMVGQKHEILSFLLCLVLEWNANKLFLHQERVVVFFQRIWVTVASCGLVATGMSVSRCADWSLPVLSDLLWGIS